MSALNRIIFLVFFCYQTFSLAQLSDLARVDATLIPSNNSDVEFIRTRALFNYPIKLKKEGAYLLLGLDYSNINLSFRDREFPFNRGLLNDFQLLDLTIGYTKPLKNNWRLGVRIQPGFSTNLTAKALNIKDAVISADFVFIKSKKITDIKKSRLILGVSYSGNRGFPYPLPFVSYYYKLNEKWSYNLGIPKTNLQYHFSKKNRLKLYAELDGFTANLQRGVELEDLDTAESINMSLILTGLQYEYHFTKHLQLYLRTAYIFSNNNTLRNAERENIYTINNKNSVYFRGGLKFKI